MGTNYYLVTRNKVLAHDFFEGEYELVDEPDFGYEIHLNKLSYGWKPLFQRHNKAFKTWNELQKFYLDHASDLKIYDEYGTYYEFWEYKKEILDHAAREPKPVKWEYDYEPIDLKYYPETARKHLHTVSCHLEEAELWTPFDHIEYFETEKAAKKKFGVYSYHIFDDFKYWNDPDYKIDWTEGDFS